jgi:hypothetical protein
MRDNSHSPLLGSFAQGDPERLRTLPYGWYVADLSAGSQRPADKHTDGRRAK